MKSGLIIETFKPHLQTVILYLINLGVRCTQATWNSRADACGEKNPLRMVIEQKIIESCMQGQPPVKRKHTNSSKGSYTPKNWPVNVKYTDGIIFDMGDGFSSRVFLADSSEIPINVVPVKTTHVEIRFLPASHPGNCSLLFFVSQKSL